MRDSDAIYRKVLLPPVRRLTRNDAEVAHDWLLKGLAVLQNHPRLHETIFRRSTIDDPRLNQSLMDGLVFKNPFGTAAGADKNASIYPSLVPLTGIGYVEVGGVTLEAQPGNPRPRLVRVGTNNLINSMGFPNEGLDAVLANLQSQPSPVVPIGLQAAKQKTTPDDQAAGDYAEIIRKASVFNGRLLPDYFTINVSSPNTPGLRSLQAPQALRAILEESTEALDAHTGLATNPRRRLLIKLSPELTEPDIEAIIDLVEQFDLGGIALTNTTTTRPVSSKHNERPGGFSGSALYGKSSRLVRFAASRLRRHRVLIASGGIDTADRAYEMLQHADLIGGYTGLVLQGPNLFRRLSTGVLERMEADGIANVADLKTSRPI
jgi:dihydroorotate dehydrogenase